MTLSWYNMNVLPHCINSRERGRNLCRRFDVSSVPQEFYVYTLVRPDGRVFYVGKGKGDRIFDHDKEARQGHQCHKCNIIRKIWRQGKTYQRYYVFTTTDEDEAYTHERELIAQYGRKNLANLTDGGEGLRNPAPEVRERLAAPNRGKSPSNKGKPCPPEMRARISATLKGRSLAPHVREQFARVNIGRKYSTEHRENIASGQTDGRTYTIVSPDDVVYPEVVNLVLFEREHGITDGLWHVMHGKAGHAYGWYGWINGETPKPPPRRFTAIAPDGTRHDRIVNIALFARKHGIGESSLWGVLHGKRPHTQGWIGWEEGKEPAVKHQPLIATVTDPQGRVYRGVHNITAFAREHKLTATALLRVISGEFAQHKGWTAQRGSC